MTDFEAHQSMRSPDRAADRRRYDRQQGRERAVVKSAWSIYRHVEAAVPDGEDIDRAGRRGWSILAATVNRTMDAPDDMRRVVDEVATSSWSIWKR